MGSLVSVLLCRNFYAKLLKVINNSEENKKEINI